MFKSQIRMDFLKGFSPMPPYILIKINKQEQQEKKEKIGSLYFPSAYAFMRRELQFGIIESIGEGAAEFMPEMEVGDYALIHHFTSGKKDDKGYNFYIIGEDDEFAYYVINVYEIPGERQLLYAIAKGEEIIPTPDHIFLEVSNENIREWEENKSGILTRSEVTKSREEWVQLTKDNFARIRQLAKNIPFTQLEYDRSDKEIVRYSENEIKRLQAENAKISKMLNKREYKPYVVAAINEQWNDWIEQIEGERIYPGETVYFLNIAAQTKMDFGGVEYIVGEVKYFCHSEKYLKKSIATFNATSSNNTPAKKTVHPV